MGRRCNVTRIISIRCSALDCAAIAKLCEASRLQPSSAARFAVRCVSLCDFDASVAAELNATLNALGREFNSATHQLNLAARLLLSPQQDPHTAYLRAVSCLTKSIDLYASVESSLTLTSAEALDLFDTLDASHLIYVPGKIPVGSEQRRLNFRVDQSDAEGLDRLAASLGVTRTLIVRSILGFVAAGDLEFGDKCALFNDATLLRLDVERRHWASNLSQAQKAVASTVTGYSRARETSLEKAVEINRLLTEASAKFNHAFSAMSALVSPTLSRYRLICSEGASTVSSLISCHNEGREEADGDA